MINRDYHLRSRIIKAPTHTPAQLTKNQTLTGIPKTFPTRRRDAKSRNRVRKNGKNHTVSRGLNREGNECYRLAALQCLLHLPRALQWFLQHDIVRPGATATSCVVNPCHINARDPVTGSLLQDEQDCMVCAMKALILRYWGDYRMHEKQPMPLEPDDPMLTQIYNYSATHESFKPRRVKGRYGKITWVDPQCDAEEWMTYFLDECQQASDPNIVPDWAAKYRALFQFEFEERRFCHSCKTHLPPNPDPTIDAPSSFRPPSIGFTTCVIDRNNPGTVTDAINTQLADDVDGLTRDCPNCGPKQLVRKCFLIDAAPEYMLVKFNITYNAAPPRSRNSKVLPIPDIRKITDGKELPTIEEKLDLTRHQVDASTNLRYRLVAALPHMGAYGSGHWIATVRNHPRWYNINDGHVEQVGKDFALSNPETVPVNWNGTDDEKKRNSNRFQVAVLMYARIE